MMFFGGLGLGVVIGWLSLGLLTWYKLKQP